MARITLPAEDPAAVIDIVGQFIDLVYDFIFSQREPFQNLPEANEESLPEGAYMLQLQACAVMNTPLSLFHAGLENYLHDIETLSGWPGSTAFGNAANACAQLAFENAVDITSLVLDISNVVKESEVIKGPWKETWAKTADIAFSVVTSTTDEAWNSSDIRNITATFVKSIFTSVGEVTTNAALKSTATMFAQSLSLVDLPGKLSTAASLTARSVSASGMTPLESTLIVVGHPWDATPPPAGDLVAHYAFDDCADLGLDKTGNGFDGVLEGSPQCVSGPIGTAVRLPTGNDYISIGQDLSLPTSFTTAFWVYIDQANTDFNYFLQGAATGNENEFNFNWNPKTLTMEMGFGSQAGQTSSSTIDLVGSWHHVAYVNNEGAVDLYINGAPFDSYSFNPESLLVEHMVLGQEQDCVGGCLDLEQALLGSLDDVRIYSKALSASEVENLFAQGGGAGGSGGGLVTHYSFDGCDGTDASGNGHSITLPAEAQCVSGAIGNAIDFSATSGTTVDILDLPTGTASRSIAAWVRMDSGTSGHVDQSVGGWGGSGGDRSAFALRYGIGASYTYGLWLHGCTYDLIVGGGECEGGTPGALTGEWHHLAATYDSVTGDAILYFDGVESARRNLNLDTTLTSLGIAVDVGSPGVASFPGVIDDFRVYNRSLSAAEVSDLHAAGSIPTAQ